MAMNRELIKAFQRLEQRERARKRGEEHQELKKKAEQIASRMRGEQMRRRTAERVVLAVAFILCAAVISAAWYNYDGIRTAMGMKSKPRSAAGAPSGLEGAKADRSASQEEKETESGLSAALNRDKPFSLHRRLAEKEKKEEKEK